LRALAAQCVGSRVHNPSSLILCNHKTTPQTSYRRIALANHPAVDAGDEAAAAFAAAGEAYDVLSTRALRRGGRNGGERFSTSSKNTSHT
jgi:hypothetical protein